MVIEHIFLEERSVFVTLTSDELETQPLFNFFFGKITFIHKALKNIEGVKQIRGDIITLIIYNCNYVIDFLLIGLIK